MTLAFVTVVILLGQAAPRQAAPPAQPPVNCFAQTDPAVMAFCAGQDALSRDRQDPGARARAVEAFRRAADLSRDSALKKRALEQLEILYDAEHLNQPLAADPILRELIALTPGDLAPMFRLAKLQERQELFDAAESTLLAARQQKPDDPAPWRELGQYFARRAGTLAVAKEIEERANKPQDGVEPDKDGLYPVGGPVQAPELLSPDTIPMPPEMTSGAVSGLVGIEVVVDEAGRVTSAKIIRSVAGLDAPALALVRQWRYKPATLNGRPVPVRFPAVVRFGGGAEPLSSGRTPLTS